MARSDNSRGIRLIALLLALLTGGFAFIWVLTNDLKFDWATPSNSPSSSAASPQSEPLQARSQPAPVAERGADLAAPVTGSTAGDPPAPERAGPEPIIEPLHQPDYGELLRRGGARAVFALRDAQGASLGEASVRVQLFRKLGSYWLGDTCRYEDGEIRCIGLAGTGLEPGEYELEIDAGLYGGLHHTFHVARGQQLVGEVRTPYWRRVICFRLADPEGAPVAWVHDWPRVSHGPSEFASRPRGYAPQEVLRSRPREGSAVGLGGGSGGRGGSGGFSYKRAKNGQVFATDEGRVYAVVYAGRESTVTLLLREAYWGTGSVEFTGNFESPEWSDKLVVLPVTTEYAAYVQESSQRAEDPGQRSLLTPAELAVPKDMCRVSMQLAAPEGFEPMICRIEPASSKALELSDFKPMERRGDRWVMDVAMGSQVLLYFTDQMLFHTDPESLEIPQQDTLVLQRTFTPSTLPPLRWEVTPTVDALPASRWLLLQPSDSRDSETPVSQPRNYAVGQRPGPVYWSESTSRTLQSYGAIRCSWAFRGVEGSRDRTDWGGSSETWNGEDLWQALQGGELQPKPALRGLAFRAVGDNGEGLPWVEASLIPYEFDEAAQELLRLEPTLKAAGVYTRVGAVAHGHYRALDHAWFDYDNPDEGGRIKARANPDLAEFLPDRMADYVTDPDAQYWFALNGAWYDTANRRYTDHHGYMYTDSPWLAPDSIWVLYLWSNSRDDSAPDRRIVFKATEAVTDLGVIMLPSYR